MIFMTVAGSCIFLAKGNCACADRATACSLLAASNIANFSNAVQCSRSDELAL